MVHKGITWNKTREQFRVRYKGFHVGYFDEIDTAIRALKERIESKNQDCIEILVDGWHEPALVDFADKTLLIHDWYAVFTKGRKNIHVYTKVMWIDGLTPMRMHDMIMQLQMGRLLNDNEQVIHLNGKGWDNRRANLELKTIK